MIIFGTRSRVVNNKFNGPIGTCTHCGTPQSLTGIKVVKYFHIFWIPVFPYTSAIASTCSHCKRYAYQHEMDAASLQKFRNDGLPKTPIKYYSGLILFGLLILVFFIAIGSTSSDTKKYLEHPQVGDVYEIKEKNKGNTTYTLYRIADITADSITFDLHDYEATGFKAYRQLKNDYADSYSEQMTVPISALKSLKRDGKISSINRK